MNGSEGKGDRRSFFTSRRNVMLGIIAGLILAVSFGALVYNAINTRSTEIITVNGREYQWETLMDDFDVIEVDGHEGIPLDALLEDAGLSSPEGESFRFIGADGYQKEMPWSDAKNGLLDIEEKKAIFPELAKAFWVRDLVEIEVV